MKPNIINRIIAKKKEFIDNNKQRPTKLYLTISDELDLSFFVSFAPLCGSTHLLTVGRRKYSW